MEGGGIRVLNSPFQVFKRNRCPKEQRPIQNRLSTFAPDRGRPKDRWLVTGTFDLREYFDLARKWLWLFALSTAVAAVGAWLATLGMPRQYAKQTTLLVGRAAESANPDFQEIYLTQNLAQLYASMATRQPVMQRAVETLGWQISWQALRGLVQASPVPGSALIEIRVIDTDAERAPLIAGAVAEALQLQLAEETFPMVLGPWVRGGAPTAVDRQLGMAYGAGAVRAIQAGSYGTMVAFVPPELKFVPLPEAINKVRTVPLDGGFVQIARSLGIFLGKEL